MAHSLILGVCLLCPSGGLLHRCVVIPQTIPIPHVPSDREFERAIEGQRRYMLESTRATRVFVEDNIKLFEKLLASDIFTLAEASALRADLEEFRENVLWFKQIERDLWEQQPGGITAPAPRPVKR